MSDFFLLFALVCFFVLLCFAFFVLPPPQARHGSLERRRGEWRGPLAPQIAAVRRAHSLGRAPPAPRDLSAPPRMHAHVTPRDRLLSRRRVQGGGVRRGQTLKGGGMWGGGNEKNTRARLVLRRYFR